MKWSLKLFRFSGIDVFVHWTFLILVFWIFMSHVSQGHTTAMAVEGVVFVVAIFACVVMHEFGHALTAKRFGISTRDITLFPIGGVARLERIPEEPMQEFWVAIAGPAVNVAIAAILAIVLMTGQGIASLTRIEVVGGDFMTKLLAVNILLVVFNLLPAFPMDGGRILRALLARKHNYVSATQTAATIGQMMAIGFGVLGFFGNPFLIFIALFIYIGAQQEANLVQIKSVMSGVPVRAAMLTNFQTVSESDSLRTVVSHLIAGEQQDFPVVADGRLLGVLTRADLLAALAQGRIDETVRDVMRYDCRTVDEHEMLETTFAHMQEKGCPVLPVFRGGRLVGIVNLENIGEWMMIQSALRQATERSAVSKLFRD